MVLPNQMKDDDNKALGLCSRRGQALFHGFHKFFKEKEKEAAWPRPSSGAGQSTDPKPIDTARTPQSGIRVI